MNMNEIKNAINETLSDPKTKKFFESEINRIAEEKAKLLLDKDKDELIEKEFRKEINFVRKNLSKYVTETVREFIDEHEEKLNLLADKKKIDSVMESLTSVLLTMGINAEELSEGVKNRTNEIVTLKQRIDNLKRQLLEEQETIKELQNQISISEDYKSKIKDLNNSFNEELNSLKKKNDSLKEKNNSLKNDYDSLINENKKLKIKNNNLNEENNDILKKNAIIKMKNGMTLTESKEFEDSAMNIPYDNKFIDRLKELKETFKENLNEVCPKEETDVPERLKRLL